MCLAIAGDVIALIDDGSPMRRAVVEVRGRRHEVSLACTPEAGPGDVVLIHAGLAIATLDPAAAARLRADLAALEALTGAGQAGGGHTGSGRNDSGPAE